MVKHITFNVFQILQELDDGITRHTVWMKNVHRALVCDGDLINRDDLLPDAHHRCDFGCWYDEVDQPELLVEPGFASIERGQVWRLISPIFVHFGVLHLVFNLWWLKDFGSAIERVFSSTYLLVLVLVFGLTSNVAQYWWVGSPMFGGMSGVLYGLFGFLWLRGRLDPSCPVSLPNGTTLILLLWYVACLVGVIPNVANAAHTDGLVLGAAWGYLSIFARKGAR